MNADQLPGKPLSLALRCPGCGWGFDLGLRDVGWQEDVPGEEDMHCGFTVCSKCLAAVEFDMRDGSGAQLVTDERMLTLPDKTRRMILAGKYVAWVAQQIEAQGRPLQ